MKNKKSAPPIHCLYGDFIQAFPPGHRPTLPNLIQRSKRGTFPRMTRLQGKRSPALFVRLEVMEYTTRTFSDFFPETVENVAKALGLDAPKKGGRP